MVRIVNTKNLTVLRGENLKSFDPVDLLVMSDVIYYEEVCLTHLMKKIY
jgi:hypothetical protein